jgi:hypothetical protein
METEKDRWDKLEIIGKVVSIFLIPIIIAIIGLVSYRFTTAAYDVDVVTRFSDLYYHEETQNTRRLSIHFIKLIDDVQTRNVLRQFVIWDTLERNMSSNFKFDQELDDWHMVGDAIYDMAEDDHENAKQFWCNLRKTTLERWPQQEVELIKLYEWIRDIYQKEGFTWADCQ